MKKILILYVLQLGFIFLAKTPHKETFLWK